MLTAEFLIALEAVSYEEKDAHNYTKNKVEEDDLNYKSWFLKFNKINIEKQDRREGGVARVVTRGPGAFRGPEERHMFLICSLFSVFLKERL